MIGTGFRFRCKDSYGYHTIDTGLDIDKQLLLEILLAP